MQMGFFFFFSFFAVFGSVNWSSPEAERQNGEVTHIYAEAVNAAGVEPPMVYRWRKFARHLLTS